MTPRTARHRKVPEYALRAVLLPGTGGRPEFVLCSVPTAATRERPTAATRTDETPDARAT